MSDLDRFFKKLDEIIEMPNESNSDYLARMAEQCRSSFRMPFVGNHNSEEAPSIEDAFEPDNEGSHSNSNDPGNGIASKTQFPDTSELNTEIASSKRKAETSEPPSSERKDKRIRMSPEYPDSAIPNQNQIAQNPPAQQPGSAPRKEYSASQDETSVSIPNHHESRNSPEAGPSVARRIASKESPVLGGFEKPLLNITDAKTRKQTDDAGKNKPSSHLGRKKQSAIDHTPEIASGGPNEAVIPGKAESGTTKTTRTTSTKQWGQKSVKVESKYLSRDDYKKSPSMTPADYVRRLEGRVRLDRTYLTGTRIYFFGGDRGNASLSTKAKILKLARSGATVVPEYDPDTVTHIVIDERWASLSHLLEVIGVSKLRQVPAHIPILKWNWATSDNTKTHFRRYAAFIQRKNSVDAIDYDPDINPISAPITHKTDKGKSHVSEDPGLSDSFGQKANHHFRFTKSPREASSNGIQGLDDEAGASSERIAVSSNSGVDSGTRNRNKAREDPLAEFYALARTEREEEEHDNPGDGNSVTSIEKKSSNSESRSLCDGARKPVGQCPNQDVIDKLTELKKIHEQRLMTGDNFRVLKYGTAINALRTYPTRIRSTKEAMSLNGVAKKTAEKIMEIIQTGDLQRLHHERTDDLRVIELFQGIYGVGKQIAHRWYNAGCRTLDDLREGKYGVKLSSVQQIGLQYYDDINSRMPRDEAEAIFNKIKPLALKIDPKLSVDIMGSFRRGKADCGDIDILISRPTVDGRDHSGVLLKLLRMLRQEGIITEDLSLPDDWSELELCYRGLCRKDSYSRRRRIDILVVPWESRGAALLYYTGDDIFNRSMRLKANKMGYSLNQKGLFAGVIRDPQDRTRKLNQGTNIASATEREIFDKLGVPWQEPHERVRG